MLKRISPSQARLGMYVVRFEGDWFDHPFWRNRFVVSDAADLAKLRNSRVKSVFIDESKGSRVRDPRLPELFQQAVKTTETPRSRTSRARQFSPKLARAERSIQQCRRATARMFLDARMGRGLKLEQATAIVDEIATSLDRHPTALLTLMRLKSLDSYTYLHSIAVSALMVNFARHLKLERADVQMIGVAGLVHDIGKMTIPRAILLKPGALTPAEIEVIRTHPLNGHTKLTTRPGIPDIVLDVCLHHHERIDGKGYPHQLTGEALSFPAKISAICDVYDAVTSVRPYRSAWEPVRGLTWMMNCHGHFDQALLRQFVDCLGYDTAVCAPEPPNAEAAIGPSAVNGFSDPAISSN